MATLPSIFINDVTVTEENSGSKLANFTVTLSQSSAKKVTVKYTTVNKTALAGLDYNSKSGTLTFQPGETAKNISIEIQGDTIFAPKETFNVKLSNPSNATLGDKLGLGSITNDDTASTSFNYGEALQKSLLFYEAQRSGYLPDDNRIEWRGDSALNDGITENVDLTGGYYDAGDYIKFGLPMAASMTMLGWSVVEYRTAYENSGQLDEVLNTIKWGTDYILKAHVTENGATKEFWGQVGDPNYEHNNYWGPAEGINWNRPAYKLTAEKPGSDLAAESAAALAAASVIFSDTDSAYADLLLENAEQLFEFADTYRDKYSDSIPKAANFYNSGWGEYAYYDELVWGAIWLYQATNDDTYLTKAETLYQEMEDLIGGLGNWTQTWGDKNYGAAVLLADITGKQEYRDDVEGWLDYWTDKSGAGIQYTTGGLAWLTQWGSLRSTANTAFLAGVYSDNVNDKDNLYSEFAKEQIDYILGDNPKKFSYVVGYGDYFPLRSHHSGSHGGGWDTVNSSAPNKNIIYGALVGGPAAPNDYDYKDVRSDYIRNEVGIDYNAAFTGALVRLYSEFGGNPLDDTQLDALPGIVINNI